MQDSVGNYRGAIKTLERILELNPDDAYAYERIGRIYKWLHEYELSYEHYQQAEMLLCIDSISSRECESVKLDIDLLLSRTDSSS